MRQFSNHSPVSKGHLLPRRRRNISGLPRAYSYSIVSESVQQDMILYELKKETSAKKYI